ncbi:caspase family protein [Caulobacter endophyticus]|uniref:caspase family protein n=1 Tax=Caulobacter endophyticus TaxID=2172652 RepID=UPI00240FD4E0|nr:caspase family protein [Caulobacter endophyticus]MDG2528925.1 caspase family protein [Caulobacter endophyticus]
MTRVWLIAVIAALWFAATAAHAERRVALVIGASAYKAVAPLANPVNDARAVAKSLKATGFEVTEVIDPDYVRFGEALSLFRRQAAGADAALIYYAGHGVEVNGVNWLLPVGVLAKDPEDLQFEAVRSASLVEVVRSARTIRLVILDACRDNPFQAEPSWRSAGRSVGKRGLSREPDGTGNVVVLMATQAGAQAADGQADANSPFARSLATLINEPGLRLASLPGRLSRDVKQRTGFDQAPDQQGIFDEPDWAFIPAATPVPAPAAAPPVVNAGAAFDYEQAAWELCSRSQTAAPCEKYRQKYPSGRFAELAQDRLSDFAAPVRAPAAAQPSQSVAPEIVQELGLVVARNAAGEIQVQAVQPGSTAMGMMFGGDVVLQANLLNPDPAQTPGAFLTNALANQGRVKLLVRRGPTTTSVVLRPRR